MESKKVYADVVLPVATGSYTYLVPEVMVVEGVIGVGLRVEVPLGKTSVHVGVVLRLHDVAPGSGVVKSIRAVLDAEPLVTPLQLELWSWMAEYYMTPLGEVYRRLMPSAVREERVGPRMVDYLGLALTVPLTASSPISQDDSSKEISKQQAWDSWLAELGRSRAQLAALQALREALQAQFLQTGGAVHSCGDICGLVVPKREFMEQYGVKAAVIGALVERGMVVVEKRAAFLGGSSGAVQWGGVGELSDENASMVYDQMQEHSVVLLHHLSLPSGKVQFYLQLARALFGEPQSGVHGGIQLLILWPDLYSARAFAMELADAVGRQGVRGVRITECHAKVSTGRRAQDYYRMAHQAVSSSSSSGNGEVEIIVGTRAALFVPYSKGRLAMVAVEQEENFAYRQSESSPRYNGRDMAILLGQFAQAKVLLTSEAPSLESYHSATTLDSWGCITAASVSTPTSVSGARFMVLERGKGMISSYLERRIGEVTAAGHQVLVFQNRRGFAGNVECSECFYSPECPNCSVQLTYHKQQQVLRCHYCGHARPFVSSCERCNSHSMRYNGVGTQRVEELLQERFPLLSISRLDFDTASSGGSFAEIAYDFANNRSDILVGTKMMINGLDFSNVGLVSIVNADNLLSGTDFRASERAFGLLRQLSNRLGSCIADGEVIIQTSRTQDALIRMVTNGADRDFYAHELELRSSSFYPPFVRVIMIVMAHADPAVCAQAAARLDELLRPIFGNRLSPAFEPPVPKVAGRYYLHQMLRIERTRSVTKAKEIVATAVASVSQQYRPHLHIHLEL